MNRELKPSTPNPTTPMPITEPPAKAISNALPKLVRAAWVVRTLALVATRIPIKPARPEQNAPTIKESPISGELSLRSWLPLMPSSTATTNTKIASTRYSAFKNAIAPSAIAFEMRIIRSVPGSCLITQLVFQKV